MQSIINFSLYIKKLWIHVCIHLKYIPPFVYSLSFVVTLSLGNA